MRYALSNKPEVEKQFGEKGYKRMVELLSSSPTTPLIDNNRPSELFFYITSKGAKMVFKILEQTYDVCRVEFIKIEK